MNTAHVCVCAAVLLTSCSHGAAATTSSAEEMPKPAIVASTAAPSATVATGFVYFGGHRMDRPFTIGYVGGSLSVNGQVIQPPVRRAPRSSQAQAAVYRSRDSLRGVMWHTMRERIDKGDSKGAALEAAKRKLEVSPLVDSARVGTSALIVYFRGEPYPDEYPLPEMGRVEPMTADRRMQERLAQLELFTRVLEQGALLLIGRGGYNSTYHQQTASLDAAIQALLQSGSALSEEEGRLIARLTVYDRQEIERPQVLVPVR